MESFNLNIIPGKTRPVCHASQFDAGRVIRVNLFEDANIYTLSGSEEVSLSVRKPDGNVVTASIENTGDSYIEIVTTEQMTACAGSNLCELKIEDDGKVIGTMNFILETERDPLEGGIESQSEIDNLKTQVDRMVTDAVADQYDSDSVIFDDNPTEGHGTGYTVTSDGIKRALEQAGGGSVDFIEEEMIDIPTRELPFYPSGEYAGLNTTDKHILGAVNELKSTNDSQTEWLQSISDRLYGVNFYFGAVNSHASIDSPRYGEMCIAFVARNRTAIFMGSNGDVLPINADSSLTCTKVSGESHKIRITNNGGTTSVCLFFYR